MRGSGAVAPWRGLECAPSALGRCVGVCLLSCVCVCAYVHVSVYVHACV